MLKTKAIEILGGSVSAAAKEIGITYQAVDKWPDVLPERIADRVYAAIARKQFPEIGADTPQGPATTAQAATENVAEQGVANV